MILLVIQKIVLSILLIHIPRLYIESKSRIFQKNNKLHGEDSYQKSRNSGNSGNSENEKNRLFGWSHFDMSDIEWKKYVKNLNYRLINLY